MLELKNHSSDNSRVSTVKLGFDPRIGLHPIPEVLTLSANAMLFGGELFTLGALVPLGFAVAMVLGVITYKAQKHLYGDSDEAALIKALAVALLTAIPTGLPAFLTVPSGVVGLVHCLRKGNSND
jgi:hypothetical protein